MSAPSAAVSGLPVLMANDEDVDSRIESSVNDRVWEHAQWKNAAPFVHGRAEGGVLDQEAGYTFELAQELSATTTPACSE